MDLLVSLSALVKVDRVPENIRLTISHSWKYGSTIYRASGKIFGHPQGPHLCSTLGKGIEKQILALGAKNCCIAYSILSGVWC